jgi:myosin heavy subunit
LLDIEEYFHSRSFERCARIRPLINVIQLIFALTYTRRAPGIDADHLDVLRTSALPTLLSVLKGPTTSDENDDGITTMPARARSGGDEVVARRRRSVVGQFQSSLNTLLGHFEGTESDELCWVRCIKPNTNGAAITFDDGTHLLCTAC